MLLELDPQKGSPSANSDTEHNDIQSFAGFRGKACRLIRMKLRFGAKVAGSFGSFQGWMPPSIPTFFQAMSNPTKDL